MTENSNKMTVRRGATIPGLQAYSSERLDIEVTVGIPVGITITDASRELKESLDQVLNEFRSEFKSSSLQAQTSQPAKSDVQVTGPPSPLPPGFQTAADSTPELDPTYLDRLPWSPFQFGGGSWIFRDTPGAKALSEELAKQGGVLTIGNYRYKITQGRDREFINRIEAGKKP